MNRELCTCGRTVYGLGSLCPVCLDARRQDRAARPRKFPVIERTNETRRPAHLAWIRTLPCVVPGCTGTSEAAHVRLVDTGGGMGLKPPDWWTVPACGGPSGHHAEQHRIGHKAFDAKYGLDSRAIAEQLAATSPYLTKEDA
jgi:hypothetical protein